MAIGTKHEQETSQYGKITPMASIIANKRMKNTLGCLLSSGVSYTEMH